MLSKTDSASEQTKDTPMANTTKNINKDTLSAVGAAAAVVVAAAPAAHTDCGSIHTTSAENIEKYLALNRKSSVIVGGGSAEASLRGARGRHKRGTNIKVVNKLGNLNREKGK